MNTLISCCGLNCAVCEARIATLANDDELRRKTAEQWKVQFNAPEIDPGTINCTGCREPGVKIGHWAECGIRKCASAKGFQTCGECDSLEKCEIIKPVLQFSPDALQNLRSLN